MVPRRLGPSVATDLPFRNGLRGRAAPLACILASAMCRCAGHETFKIGVLLKISWSEVLWRQHVELGPVSEHLHQ